MDVLRLCFVGPAASVTFRRWVEWFAARGHETTVVTVEPVRGEAAPIFRQVDVTATTGGRKLGRLVSAVRLAAAVRRLKPDVVHVHYARGLAWGMLLAGAHPCVVTPWGSDVLEEQGAFREWYSRPLTRAVLARADLVTVHSGYMEAQTRALLPAAKFVVQIGWGVDLRRFRRGLDGRALRERWGLSDGQRVVFSPRLAKPFYRHELIIRALPRILAQEARAVLIVTGQEAEAGYVAMLRRLASDLGVADRVTFTGAIPYDEMPVWFNLAEAVVMMPRSDGMPNTLWESLACGAVPVLADLPQYADVIAHGVNGWLAKPDPGEVAEHVLRVMSDKTGRERMAERNALLAQERADQDREMSRMEGWYAELAKGAAIRPAVSVKGRG